MSKINVLLNENYTILKIIEDNTVTLMGSKYWRTFYMYRAFKNNCQHGDSIPKER